MCDYHIPHNREMKNHNKHKFEQDAPFENADSIPLLLKILFCKQKLDRQTWMLKDKWFITFEQYHSKGKGE
jgi:hypothetical protein